MYLLKWEKNAQRENKAEINEIQYLQGIVENGVNK